MPFHVSITFPFDNIEHPEAFITQNAVIDRVGAAEEAGFTSGTVTDHPVPGYRWLDNGGHYAQDPFVMLSMVTAVTTKLKVQTNIVVLPYRNPFITARAVSSLDAFSGGRFIFGIGAGYLKPEYKALGVDFDTRNDIMDEYIRAMKLAWTGEDFAFEGTGYNAVGNRMLPTPVQKPHPPLLIGGNSKRALRRTAELGDAWHPFFVPKMVTLRARTANIETDEEILAAISVHSRSLRQDWAQGLPRSDLLQHFRHEGQPMERARGYRQLHAPEKPGHCRCWGTSVFTDSRSEWCEQTLRFGEEVLTKLD